MDLDLPDLVYHYTKRETALECILPTKAIELGPLGLTNDPRETEDWGSVVAGPSELMQHLPAFEITDKIGTAANKCRQQEWCVFSTSCDDADLRPPTLDRPDF